MVSRAIILSELLLIPQSFPRLYAKPGNDIFIRTIKHPHKAVRMNSLRIGGEHIWDLLHQIWHLRINFGISICVKKVVMRKGCSSRIVDTVECSLIIAVYKS